MPRCPTCQKDLAPQTTVCPNDGTPIPPGLDGAVLGERYRLIRELGEGGMGRVYLAEHVILGKQLAVKVLRLEYSKHPELVKRFQLEAVAASQIGQENIVDVSDFGQTPDGSFYFVMEFVPGKSIAQIIDSTGPMPTRRAVPVLLQITRALGAAHQRGIVHRDLKPDNVLVTPREDGTELAKVLDFGISKVGEGPSASRITQVGMVVGTPHYMAPEQATGDPVDSRADIYAFGILAYETVVGKVPFQGENSLQILLKHQKEHAVPPRQARPDLDIPERLEQLILHCLEKDRGSRPQTMAEVGAVLAACLGDLGLVSGPMTTAELKAAPRPPTQDRPPARVAVTERGPGADLAIGQSAPKPKTEPQPSRQVTDPPLTTGEREAIGRRRGPVFFLVGAVGLGIAGVVALAMHTSQPEVIRVAAVKKPIPAPQPKPMALAPPTPAPQPRPAVQPEVKKPALQRVSLRSVPAGARVLGPDGQLGTTPLDLELADGQSREVRLVYAGYQETARQVHAGEGVVEVHLQKALARRATTAAASPTSIAKPLPSQTKPKSDGDGMGKLDDLKADPYGP